MVDRTQRLVGGPAAGQRLNLEVLVTNQHDAYGENSRRRQSDRGGPSPVSWHLVPDIICLLINDLGGLRPFTRHVVALLDLGNSSNILVSPRLVFVVRLSAEHGVLRVSLDR